VAKEFYSDSKKPDYGGIGSDVLGNVVEWK
jgi:hypothetical protein